MSVYIDSCNVKFGRMVMCHMIADTLTELHSVALQIGMKREWFQGSASFPHYDVNATRKRHALKLGVIEVDRKTLVTKIRELRNINEYKVFKP